MSQLGGGQGENLWHAQCHRGVIVISNRHGNDAGPGEITRKPAETAAGHQSASTTASRLHPPHLTENNENRLTSAVANTSKLCFESAKMSVDQAPWKSALNVSRSARRSLALRPA